MWDEDFVYWNDIYKEELSEDEIWYDDVHGKKKKRTLPGPFSATVKKNRREKYRKLKQSFEAASTVRGEEQEFSCSRNELNGGGVACTSEAVHEKRIGPEESDSGGDVYVCSSNGGKWMMK